MSQAKLPPPGAASRALTLVSLGVVSLSLGCSNDEELRARPSIVLVTFDTLRADFVGAYGASVTETPNLDAFARDSVRFQRAYSTVPLTYPSMWSLLNSTSVRNFTYETDLASGPERGASIVSRFRDAGYLTVGITGSSILKRRNGFGVGFEHYLDTWSAHSLDNETTVHRVFDVATETLAERGNRPFFLFVHFFDPHDPWGDAPEQYRRYPPEPERVTGLKGVGRGEDALALRIRRAIAVYVGGSLDHLPPETPLESYLVPAYRSDVSWADDVFGRMLGVLDQRGLLSDAVVVVTSDHGIAFRDHDQQIGYGFSLYDEVSRVPLIVHVPGRKSRSVAPAVSLLDLGPTLLDLAGLGSRHADGQSFGFLLDPEGEDGETLAYAETVAMSDAVAKARFGENSDDGYSAGVDGIQSMLAMGTRKLLYLPGKKPLPFELYDTESDPEERNNLFDPTDANHVTLGELLLRRRGGRAKESSGPNPSVHDALRALGYVE